MTKVLVPYYSSYGRVDAMARAASEGMETAGARAAICRVPEPVPAEIATKLLR